MTPATVADVQTRFLRALERVEGFAVYFAIHHDPSERRAWANRIGDRLKRPWVQLDASAPNLEQILVEAVRTADADAVFFLHGLEARLSATDEEEGKALLRWFNWRRSVLQRFGHPLVFWVPGYVVDQMAREAPDFFDWSSGVYELEEPKTPPAPSISVDESRTPAPPRSITAEVEALQQRLARYQGDEPTVQKARADTLRDLSASLLLQGNSTEALEAARASLSLSSRMAEEDSHEPTWQRDISVSLNGLGDVHTARGDLAAAQEAYQEGLAIMQRLLEQDSDNIQWQRDLSVSLNRLGDVHTARGNLAAAESVYQESLSLIRRLLKQNQNNITVQRDASSFLERGDLIRRLEDYGVPAHEGRLYLHLSRLGRARAAELAKEANISRTEAYRLLDNLVERGYVEKTLERPARFVPVPIEELLERAVGRKRRYLAELVKGQDDIMRAWPRGQDATARQLSITFERLGDLNEARGDLAAAEDAYQEALTIQRLLLKRDPDNTQLQRDLSISLNKLGDVHTARGDLTAAQEVYKEDLTIARRLLEQDPDNTLWRRDLSVSLDRLGDVHQARGDLAAAQEAYQESLTIRRGLLEQDPDNTQWQTDLVVSHVRLASVRYHRGEDGRRDARDLLGQARDRLERLERQGALHGVQRTWMERIRESIAALERGEPISP